MQIALLLYEGLTTLDVIGPYETLCRLPDVDVRFVAIATDGGDMAALSEWVRKQKLTYPVLRDNHQIVSGRYGIGSLPWSYIIDGNGRIHAIGAPTPEELEAEVEASLGALLVD